MSFHCKSTVIIFITSIFLLGTLVNVIVLSSTTTTVTASETPSQGKSIMVSLLASYMYVKNIDCVSDVYVCCTQKE